MLEKNFCKTFQKINRKEPLKKSFLMLLTEWHLTEKELHHKCFSMTFKKFLKIAIL